ncbi:MAG: hypothetical protein K2R98_15180 [Gemmataceae bacterium]|nr:hypothetical protein [Gemmataceae bacterium]
MLRKLIPASIPIAFAAGALVFTAGCGVGTKDDPQAAKTAPAPETKLGAVAKKDDEHGHKPGAHGGIIVELGRDSYHAEAVFEKGGMLRLYTLGKDESRVQEVESQTLTAYVKLEAGGDSEKVELKPQPQPGDTNGKTSQFIGQLPKEMAGQKVDVTIPSLKINGERFRLGFKSAAEEHAEDPMPAKVAGDDERKLYLTPGGKYTAEDIKANGSVVASQKFKGVMAKHDMKPKPGDKICPITETKANPKFTWVVGGKVYEFCCPPCIDEFVKMAKDDPNQVKEPKEYVKQ